VRVEPEQKGDKKIGSLSWGRNLKSPAMFVRKEKQAGALLLILKGSEGRRIWVKEWGERIWVWIHTRVLADERG